jgi:hypothetical protein
MLHSPSKICQHAKRKGTDAGVTEKLESPRSMELYHRPEVEFSV